MPEKQLIGLFLASLLLLPGCQAPSDRDQASAPPSSTDQLYRSLDQKIQEWMYKYKSGDIRDTSRQSQQLKTLVRNHRDRIFNTLESEGNQKKKAVAAAAVSFLPPSSRILTILHTLLKKEQNRIRRNALTSLGLLDFKSGRFPAARQKLTDQIQSDWQELRAVAEQNLYFAVANLVERGNNTPFLPELRKGMASTNQIVRMHCVRALAKIGTEKALKPIIQQAIQDASESVRIKALLQLQKFTVPESLEASLTKQLITTLKKEPPSNTHPSKNSRNLILELLGTLHDKPQLNQEEDWIHWYEKKQKNS